MMMTTAGGPGRVYALDFNDRKRPRFSRATWIATGIVVAAHVGLGAVLYYQRFEMPVVAPLPERPIIDVITYRLKPPEPVKTARTPPAPNPDVNDTPLPRTPVEPLATASSDKPTGETTVLTTDRPVEIVTPDSIAPGPVATPAPVITSPTWSRQPSAEQLMRAYPERALAGGVSGSASLNCLVLPNGAVTDCDVTRETPGSYGFGRAAQSLSRYFRVNPRTVNGAAEGSRVSMSLRFKLPED